MTYNPNSEETALIGKWAVFGGPSLWSRKAAQFTSITRQRVKTAYGGYPETRDRAAIRAMFDTREQAEAAIQRYLDVWKAIDAEVNAAYEALRDAQRRQRENASAALKAGSLPIPEAQP